MKDFQNQSLTTEQSFFLSVLSDYVNERQSLAISSNVDISKLVALSNSQQLAPIIFYQTKLTALQPAFASASYYAVNRKKLIDRIDQQFQSSHIPYLIFKGSEVAQYYQHPYLRTSGDTDLLVYEKDKVKAGEILEELGFVNDGKKKENHEWLYQKSGFEIELHHRLLYNDVKNDDSIISFTDTAWQHAISQEGICYHLEPEFHFVFLLLHLRKHFLWAGVGIRQFLDLTVMARNGNLDWGKVKGYINTCGIEKFSSICFALINRWFGVLIPLSTASISDDFFIIATTTVLSSSAFGNMSSDNILDNYVINVANKRGRIRSSLSILFPPYEKMQSKYPKMCKNNILGHLFFPLFWFRRFIESLFKRSTKDGLSYAAKYMKVNKGRKEELEMWGLR